MLSGEFGQGVLLGLALGLFLAYVVIPALVDGWTYVYRHRYPGARGR